MPAHWDKYQESPKWKTIYESENCLTKLGTPFRSRRKNLLDGFSLRMWGCLSDDPVRKLDRRINLRHIIGENQLLEQSNLNPGTCHSSRDVLFQIGRNQVNHVHLVGLWWKPPKNCVNSLPSLLQPLALSYYASNNAKLSRWAWLGGYRNMIPRWSLLLLLGACSISLVCGAEQVRWR